MKLTSKISECISCSLKKFVNRKEIVSKKRSKDDWRKIERMIAKTLLFILILIMLYPLFFWGGQKRWLGIFMDIVILYALYKAIFRDIPMVHIGMKVSPFWGRIPEYLTEGKHPVLPWDKVELEKLKVKTYSVKEEKGYLTLDGAPMNLTVDIFYRIDKDNIYLYKEIEGTEESAIDGKVKEYLYGKIGALETDEVIANQGDLAKGILEEIRLHPISSKEKLLSFLEKKEELLKKERESAEEKAGDEKDEDREKIENLTLKIGRIEIDIKAIKKEINALYEREAENLKRDLELQRKKAINNNDQKGLEKIEAEIKRNNEMTEKDLHKKIKNEIEKVEEAMLSELERHFAIRILGSRMYGLDIADQGAKEGRSKRTTTMYERTAILTEWGTTDRVMKMLKKKYPGLSDNELLEAVLVNRGRIKKDKKVIEIEGLEKVLPEVAKVIFGKK